MLWFQKMDLSSMMKSYRKPSFKILIKTANLDSIWTLWHKLNKDQILWNHSNISQKFQIPVQCHHKILNLNYPKFWILNNLTNMWKTIRSLKILYQIKIKSMIKLLNNLMKHSSFQKWLGSCRSSLWLAGRIRASKRIEKIETSKNGLLIWHYENILLFS